MERMTGYYNTFVVKIWCDKGAMRGHIQHVSSQELIHFLNMKEMVGFIESHLGPPRESAVVADWIEQQPIVLPDDLGVMNQNDRIFPD